MKSFLQRYWDKLNLSKADPLEPKIVIQYLESENSGLQNTIANLKFDRRHLRAALWNFVEWCVKQEDAGLPAPSEWRMIKRLLENTDANAPV